MKLNYIFAGLLLINSFLFTQSKTADYYRVILLSLKSGYHTGYDLQYDQGFPDGAVFDGSIALGVSKNIILGVNFDYWKGDKVVTHPSLTNIIVTKNYSGYGYRFFVQYRNTFFKHLDHYIDAGLGRYKISYDYVYKDIYSSDYNYYINAGFSIGAGYRFSKLFSLNAEISYYKQIDFDLGGSSSVFTTNIKFGARFLYSIEIV